jgi:hypothetical protein
MFSGKWLKIFIPRIIRAFLILGCGFASCALWKHVVVGKETTPRKSRVLQQQMESCASS